MTFLSVFCFSCAAILILSVVIRFVRIARLPVHLRWELYPVAHEKGRADYGGSILEEAEWWTKPRETSMLGDLKVMVPEILLLAGVREHNPSQWARSFPFHFGLYLLIGATFLLVVGGIFGATVPGGFFGTLVPVLGYGGFGLSLLGAAGLLHRRLTDEEYREYSVPIDYFNLGFFLVAFGVALAAQLATDPDFLGMRIFFAGLFSGAPVSLPLLQQAEVVLLALLAVYVPQTHMSHFFTKFFLYHDIRWSDEPLRPGSRLERRVGRALELRPTWDAPHIRAGEGTKTWVDVATSTGLPEETKEGEA